MTDLRVAITVALRCSGARRLDPTAHRRAPSIETAAGCHLAASAGPIGPGRTRPVGTIFCDHESCRLDLVTPLVRTDASLDQSSRFADRFPAAFTQPVVLQRGVLHWPTRGRPVFFRGE
jgi:hypothetical protein